MRPGREIDTRIATEIFGYKVWGRGQTLWENAPQGERPLLNYSRDLDSAWSVAEKMKIALLPIENDHWFAFVGPEEVHGWSSPEAMMKVLSEKKFDGCGAAVSNSAAMAICEAALKAADKRRPETPAPIPIRPANPAPDLH